MKDQVILFVVLVTLAWCVTVLARGGQAPTRPLPDSTATASILADDALDGLGRGQPPFVCYNTAGDVVMILDPHTGQGRFDLSGGLTQTFKCRN